MIFCYSDIWLGNFIIDDGGHVTIVDFAHASILPSSFSKFALIRAMDMTGCDMSNWLVVPATPGVDNTSALLAASGPMVLGPSSFVTTGRRIPGG
jgi:hypothetical protein